MATFPMKKAIAPRMKIADARKPQWHIIDAQGQHVGRLASRLAPVLIGKHKPIWEPHRHEHGDFIIVLNASKVEFTGRKWSRKIYYKHSGYPGGLKARNANDIERRNPGDVLRKAVVGMLPRNKLRDIFKKRLKIYAGEEHDYEDKLVGERAAMSPLDDIISGHFCWCESDEYSISLSIVESRYSFHHSDILEFDLTSFFATQAPLEYSY